MQLTRQRDYTRWKTRTWLAFGQSCRIKLLLLKHQEANRRTGVRLKWSQAELCHKPGQTKTKNNNNNKKKTNNQWTNKNMVFLTVHNEDISITQLQRSKLFRARPFLGMSLWVDRHYMSHYELLYSFSFNISHSRKFPSEKRIQSILKYTKGPEEKRGDGKEWNGTGRDGDPGWKPKKWSGLPFPLQCPEIFSFPTKSSLIIVHNVFPFFPVFLFLAWVTTEV